MTPALKETLYLCLLCRTCTLNCPAGVQIDKIIEEARGLIEEEGTSLTKRMIFNGFLTHPALLRASSSLLQAYQRTGLQGMLSKSRLLDLLPGDLPNLHDLIPPIPRRPASKSLPSIAPARGEKQYRVGYFLGCAVNLLQGDVASATVKSLQESGCEVVLPGGLKCCGMPHRGYGMQDMASELALHNLGLFQEAGVDAIISDCASCTSTLVEYEGWVGDGDPLKEYARTIPIYDVVEFIVKELDWTAAIDTRPSLKVTYHDPCHLVRCSGREVRKEPRILLDTLCGSNFVEMEGADVCCGGGGTFNLTHYGTSLGILEKKMDFFQESGATHLATSCPGCSIQLAYGLRQLGDSFSLLHPIQLLVS